DEREPEAREPAGEQRERSRAALALLVGPEPADRADHRQVGRELQFGRRMEDRLQLAQHECDPGGRTAARPQYQDEQQFALRRDRIVAHRRRIDYPEINLLALEYLTAQMLALETVQQRLVVRVNHIVVAVQPRQFRLDLRHLVDQFAQPRNPRLAVRDIR